MSETLLFWHRRDLRLSDSLGLAAARARSPQLVGVFCLDPGILECDDVAPARVAYMLGCLQELQAAYEKAGSQLLVLQGQPEECIPALAVALEAAAVYWHCAVEPYGRQRDARVRDALQESGIPSEQCWDRLLHPPGTVKTQNDDPYRVYTPFWRNWSDRSKPDPAARIEDLVALTDRQQAAAREAGATALPSLQDLGFVWETELPLAPGETAARDRLEEFCDRAVAAYDDRRNFPAVTGTSLLSAALKFGAVGIRTVWQTVETARDRAGKAAGDNIVAWQQELAWREFYQHALYFFPELADGPYREEFQDFPWEDNREHLQAWQAGQTGYPIVDAAMRQLHATGWMHNRCRMIVASFLTKDLILDWRWGERHFMRVLFDGDLAANNGGWQWSASSGMDPKPLRIFNPASQAQKYDPEGKYIRQWVPELRSLPTKQLLSGEIAADDRRRCGYPAAIVNHKDRQAEFKQRYKTQKERSA